jgi:hypothetical protein
MSVGVGVFVGSGVLVGVGVIVGVAVTSITTVEGGGVVQAEVAARISSTTRPVPSATFKTGES